MAISQSQIDGKQTCIHISPLTRDDNVIVFSDEPVVLRFALNDLQPHLRIECTPTTIEFVTSEDAAPPPSHSNEDAAPRSSDSNEDEGRPSNITITRDCRCPDCGTIFDEKSVYDHHVLVTHTRSLDIKYNHEGTKLKDAYVPI
jgi:uncharacterized C2H2 Zn-finger protein